MHLLKIRVSPQRVYPSAHDGRTYSQLWTCGTVLDSKIGGTGEFGFFKRRIVTKMEVDELQPPVRMGWKAISSLRRGGTARRSRSLCERMERHGARLRGFKEADEGYARTATGWAYYLASLRQNLETGKAHPTQLLVLRALPGESSYSRDSCVTGEKPYSSSRRRPPGRRCTSLALFPTSSVDLTGLSTIG